LDQVQIGTAYAAGDDSDEQVVRLRVSQPPVHQP
jgi:hypothetical protein